MRALQTAARWEERNFPESLANARQGIEATLVRRQVPKGVSSSRIGLEQSLLCWAARGNLPEDGLTPFCCSLSLPSFETGFYPQRLPETALLPSGTPNHRSGQEEDLPLPLQVRCTNFPQLGASPGAPGPGFPANRHADFLCF